MGGLSLHITTTELKEYCSTNKFDVPHAPQIYKPELLLQTFHCSFKFDDKKLNYIICFYSFKVICKQSCT